MMRQHDALPPALRLVAISTTENWAADCIRQAYAATSPTLATGARLRRTLDLLDRVSAEETWRSYGPDHPQCPADLKTRRAPKGAWWAQQSRRAK